MKSLMTMLAAALLCGAAAAADAERVSVVVGESSTLNAPFEVTGFTPSSREIVNAEALGGSVLRVQGLKRGRCTLTVTGAAGLTHTYDISVVGNLASQLETLLQDLDTLPEVRAEIRGNAIRLDGEIKSIAKWEYYMKVVSVYGDVVNDFVRFSPGKEIARRLAELFADAGFSTVTNKFGADVAKWPFDSVAIVCNDSARSVTVQAAFLTKDRLTKADSILASIPWLARPGAKANPHAFTLLDEMRVANPIIRLGVAYYAISDSEIDALGNPDHTFEIGGVFDWVRAVAGSDTPNSKDASVQANINAIAKFSAETGIGRISDVSYVAFESWDEEGGEFKSGGTKYIEIATGLSSNVKDIPYGFIIKSKGGLVTEDKTMLTLDIEVSRADEPKEHGVDKYEEHTKQTLTCPLGQTLAIGGFGGIEDSNNLDGVPIVRHIPIVKWFFANDTDNLVRRHVIILVSPEIVDIGTVGTLEVDKNVNEPAKRDANRSIEETQDARKRFHGFWTWLNWFMF